MNLIRKRIKKNIRRNGTVWRSMTRNLGFYGCHWDFLRSRILATGGLLGCLSAPMWGEWPRAQRYLETSSDGADSVSRSRPHSLPPASIAWHFLLSIATALLYPGAARYNKQKMKPHIISAYPHRPNDAQRIYHD